MAHTHSNGHHGHSHPLGEASDYLNKAFTIGIILNIVFVVVEFGSGLYLDSVALMSDAGHNLSDVVGLALAMLAFKLAQQKPTKKYTYGRKKSTVIASLANACILLIAIGIIMYESVGKLFEPQPIQGGSVALVAGIGILINGFTAWLFMRHRKLDLNVKGAYLHMVADTLVSVGVLVSGIVIKYTGWYILDPIIGITIAVVIFISTWGLLKDSIRLSLDGVPPGIKISDIKDEIMETDDRIVDVHHIHVWALSTTETALTAHVVVNQPELIPQIKHKIKHSLQDADIAHSTLEFEIAGEDPMSDCEECKLKS